MSRRIRAAQVRFCKRGFTQKRYNTIVNGDFYNYDKDYKDALNFVVSWIPNPVLKEWVDNYCRDYYLIIKHNNVEVKFNYPRDYEELATFILEKTLYPKDDWNQIIASKNLDILLEVLAENEIE